VPLNHGCDLAACQVGAAGKTVGSENMSVVGSAAGIAADAVAAAVATVAGTAAVHWQVAVVVVVIGAVAAGPWALHGVTYLGRDSWLHRDAGVDPTFPA